MSDIVITNQDHGNANSQNKDGMISRSNIARSESRLLLPQQLTMLESVEVEGATRKERSGQRRRPVDDRTKTARRNLDQAAAAIDKLVRYEMEIPFRMSL